MSLDAGRVGVRADQVDVHGRVTSPSFLNELLEDLPEWTDMPVWVNGTEELLPSNNSVPVTSPILADIAYPDIRRDNQYFTYRESPTPVDGLAKIKSIKGNTLVWNQLVRNGNFVNTDNWNGNGTISVSSNALSYDKPAGWNALNNTGTFKITNGHKYLVKYKAYVENNTAYLFWTDGTGTSDGLQTIYAGGTWKDFSLVITARRDFVGRVPWFDGSNPFIFHLKEYMVIDITKLNDSRITDYNSFKTYYPLPYYDFNQGSLLSFNGNGIKTVGKNLFHNTTVSATNNGITWTVNEDGSVTANGTCTTNVSVFKMYTPLIPAGTYIINGTPSGSAWGGSNPTWRIRLGHQDGSYINDVYAEGRTFTLTQDEILEIQCNIAVGKTVSNQQWLPMIRFADVTDSTFEPYTSSTLSLPISTYFPTGMKSAGTVYDELTPRKAITRIGAVDLGSVTWTYNSTDKRFYANIEGVKVSPTSGTAFSSGMLTVPYQTIFTDTPVSFGDMLAYIADKDMLIWQYTTGGGVANVNIKNTNYTDATAFKTAMSGVYLYYELATPVELPTLSLGD